MANLKFGDVVRIKDEIGANKGMIIERHPHSTHYAVLLEKPNHYLPLVTNFGITKYLKLNHVYWISIQHIELINYSTFKDPAEFLIHKQKEKINNERIPNGNVPNWPIPTMSNEMGMEVPARSPYSGGYDIGAPDIWVSYTRGEGEILPDWQIYTSTRDLP